MRVVGQCKSDRGPRCERATSERFRDYSLGNMRGGVSLIVVVAFALPSEQQTRAGINESLPVLAGMMTSWE